jgi:recombination associated protein RdgC
MDILELLHKKNFWGQEFLTWLWFKSETQHGLFTLDDSQQVELWLDDKVVLQSEGVAGVQTVTCQGENLELTEAKHALREGKKVTQAKIKLIIGDNEWAFTLDATWLNFRGLKTPRVMLDTKEDPEGLFYEKTYLLDTAISTVEQLFIQFLKIRIADKWDAQEIPAIRKWMQG